MSTRVPVAFMTFFILFMLWDTPFANPPNMKAPWPDGMTVRCNQGNFGAFSHNNPLSFYAWDFGLAMGTPVLAAAHGSIYAAGFSQSGYGNFIMIQHGNGFYSIYGHLSEMNVAIGKQVVQGEIIAYSGCTGLTTGPHLHFSIINRRGYSLPSEFSDIGIPEEGLYYTSQNGCKERP